MNCIKLGDMKNSKCSKFFSLVELLVVFAILAILMSLLSARLNKLSEFSQMNRCQNQMKNIFVGLQLYINDHDNYLPGPLLSGQHAYFGKWNLAGFLGPYLTPVRRSDGKSWVLPDMICPSNYSDQSNLAQDFRLHYRTHFDKNSTTYFGYPYKKDSLTIDSIPNPMRFNFLRDHSKWEYDQSNSKPGWYDRLSDLPPHFKTDVNILSMDGRVTPTVFIE